MKRNLRRSMARIIAGHRDIGTALCRNDGAPLTYCSPDDVVRNAQCLLGRVEEVRFVLRRRGYSAHAIDQAVTAVYRAAMSYITGRRLCAIKHRRAWVMRVAFSAAGRAAKREVVCHAIEPAILAATAKDQGEHEDQPFNICDALGQLTEQQSEAVQLCFLNGLSIRDAAKVMDKSRGTVSGYLQQAKQRLKVILAPYQPQTRSA